MGDFNSRTGKYSDNVCQENDQSEFSLAFQRHSFSNELNNRGKRLLEICRSADLEIMNGRFHGDSLARPTFHGKSGVGVVDYAVCSLCSRRRKGKGIGRKKKKEGDWGERVRDACFPSLFPSFALFSLPLSPSPFCACHTGYAICDQD